MKKFLLPAILVVLIIGTYYFIDSIKIEKPIVVTPTPEPILPNPVIPTPEPEPTVKGEFKTVTLTSERPGAELAKITGATNVFTALAINRIDDQNLTQGMTLVVPTSFKDASWWEFMPATIEAAQNIPKLAMVSQRTQAFGFYEYGKLVRSGPVSSGKESTKTPNGLFFTNWKGKEVISTFSEEWILKWNFNIQNRDGIALHQYALPGFPASHSCVRLYEKDAKYFYDWANQWVLAPDGQTKLASGTPVIIFGKYDFAKKAPWKQLPENPDALKVTQDEVEELVNKNLAKIQAEQASREQVLGAN